MPNFDWTFAYILVNLLFMAICGFLLSLVTGSIDMNIVQFIYTLCSGGMPHYLDKRKLVCGDVVFVDFRGSLKKATISYNSQMNQTVQVKFDDDTLKKFSEYNNFDYSRIYIPKHLSKASKILFAVRKDK